MTIVVDGDDYIVEQVSKQLNKLIYVIKVQHIPDESVIRELALIKVNAPSPVRNEIIEIVNIFRSKIVDISKNTVTIETTGDSSKIPALLDILRPFGIQEVVRTGAIAIERGPKSVKVNGQKSEIDEEE
jgi:acetolactate synthase-1/3 small subunit